MAARSSNRPDLSSEAHASCLLSPCAKCAERNRMQSSITADWIEAGRPTQAQSKARIDAILKRPGALTNLYRRSREPGSDDE